MSAFQDTGLLIKVHRPSIDLGAPSYVGAGAFVETLSEQVGAYSHVTSAVGGYDEASFTIADRLDRLEDWLDRGINRHVEIYNPALEKIWEGFANEIVLTVGPLTATRGPLMDVANRVSLVYSGINTATNPPTPGERTETAIANHAESQAQYAILEQVLSTGGMETVEANQVRDTYLAEHALPETSQHVALGTTAEPTVRVNCLGYYHRMNAWVYNQTVLSGTRTLSDKIGDILNADPNGMFASANADITANALLVVRYENNDRKAWNLIKSLVAHGDANDDRYILGVYSDFRVVYEQVPTGVGYFLSLSEDKQRVILWGDLEVRPWDVRAGRWLQFADFLAGTVQPANLRDDPRVMFIEQLTFTAPYSLQLEGGKVTTLRQKMEKMGLGGIAA